MNEFISLTPAETRNFAKQWARSLKKGDVVALIGRLGGGKTEFTRGVCECFQCHSSVTSPSFAIVNTYQGINPADNTPIEIYHFDFYRINSEDELHGIGLNDYLYDEGICLIEWADRYKNALPKNTRSISFQPIGENKRKISYY